MFEMLYGDPEVVQQSDVAGEELKITLFKVTEYELSFEFKFPDPTLFPTDPFAFRDKV